MTLEEHIQALIAQYQKMQQRHKMRADNAYYQFQSEMWQAMSDDYLSAPKSAMTSRPQRGGQSAMHRAAHLTRGKKARKPASGTQRSWTQSFGQTAGQRMPPV